MANKYSNNYECQQIENIFLPAPSHLKDHFNRGYVTTKVKSGSLEIIDLLSMKFVGEVDLSEYQCSARDVAYVPIGWLNCLLKR